MNGDGDGDGDGDGNGERRRGTATATVTATGNGYGDGNGNGGLGGLSGACPALGGGLVVFGAEVVGLRAPLLAIAGEFVTEQVDILARWR